MNKKEHAISRTQAISTLTLPGEHLVCRWTSCAECPLAEYDGAKGVWCLKFHAHYDYHDGCSKGPLG